MPLRRSSKKAVTSFGNGIDTSGCCSVHPASGIELLALSYQDFHLLSSGSPIWLSVATSSPAQGERTTLETTGLQVLRRDQTSLRSHSLPTAGYLIWSGSVSTAEGIQRRTLGWSMGWRVFHCVERLSQWGLCRFVQTGDEKAPRGNVHSHPQGHHQAGRHRISTAGHSRKTNQNNFGLDMGGIFHHGKVKPGSGLSREAVQPLSLEAFRT